MRANELVSVVVPTAGRAALLEAALESIVACNPRADEVVVVAQGEVGELRRLIARYASARVRLVPCPGRGVARGTNVGLRAAHHDIVLVTHDDCTVAPDWVAEAVTAMNEVPGGLVTGQVRAASAGGGKVPSTIEAQEPHDYTGQVRFDVLYPANMCFDRRVAFRLGEFDERRSLSSAEDNDFCLRWLKAGLSLRYRPTMVVWHHDWRTPEQLVRLYRSYARSQGALYAKHLLDGDTSMVRHLAQDLVAGMRHQLGSLIRGGRRATIDERIGVLTGMPVGFLASVAESLHMKVQGARLSTRSQSAARHDSRA